MLVVLLSSEVCAQGITVDGRLGPAQALAGPNYAIGAGLGRQVGGNLFHSFGAFGLKQGETATFSGPASVGNVIGRVTGGATSSINGGIRSTIPGANLYLVNPAGVVFGPNASVDVSGSFHASSADYLRMQDGARFGATNPDASTLSAAPPEAFGFLSASPQPVAINGSNLQLAPRNTLGLVGGAVTISGGVLQAPSGTVHVASAAGRGEVPVDPRAGPPPTVARFGRVQVANKASINVAAASASAGSGSVYMRAGDLSVAASTITADNRGAGPGGMLSLHGDRTVALNDSATVRAASSGAGQGPGVSIGTAAGGAVTLDMATVSTTATAAGNGGAVAIDTGTLTLQNGAVVVSGTAGSGAGGPSSVTADSVLLDGSKTQLFSQTTGTGQAGAAGAGGSISLNGGTITVQNGASVLSGTFGAGSGGAVSVAADSISLDGVGTRFTSQALGAGLVGGNGVPTLAGTGGKISLTGGTLSVQNHASIQSATFGSGAGGPMGISMTGNVTVATGAQIAAGSVPADAPVPATATGNDRRGDAGSVTLTAQDITILPGSLVITTTSPFAGGGALTVTARGDLTVDGRGGARRSTAIATQSSRDPTGLGNAGTLEINAANITLMNAQIDGSPADVAVTAKGALNLGQASSIESNNISNKNAFTVSVTAGSLKLMDGSSIQGNTLSTGPGSEIMVNVVGTVSIGGVGPMGSSIISGYSVDRGNAGNVTVNAGTLTLSSGGLISSAAYASGNAGEVVLNVEGALTIDGDKGKKFGSGVTSEAASYSSGSAGTIRVNAGSISITNGGLSSSTDGRGQGGSVTVNADTLSLRPGGLIASATSASGNAGEVVLNVKGALTIDGAGDGTPGSGVTSEATAVSSGSAGTIQVKAGSISVLNGGGISSSAAGTGAGGSVLVTTPGALLLDGGGMANSAIGASAVGAQSGDAGPVTVDAGNVTIQDGALITSSTNGRGRGGDVTVKADTLTLARKGSIASATSASGNAGKVVLNVENALTIDSAGGGKVGSGVTSQAAAHSSGSAGTIRVNAGSISILDGGLITSSTAGTGAGGSVVVTTPGTLLLDSRGVNTSAIEAASMNAQSGSAGTVSVSAGTVAIQGRARISSATNGAGQGGDVGVTATSAIRLSGAGPQISAISTRTGNAGSVAVAAPQINLRDGASISTAAQSANGGNITIGPGELLYLRQSSITTSVGGASGNGGNITVEPQLVVLDRSAIQANAVGGNGGNVSVRADQLVQSFDSAITATSQRGVSGEILVAAQPVNLNGSLVVLASELRSAAALLREGCAVRGASPRSSLVMAGRGGQRQGLEAMLPALYFAHRPVREVEQPALDALAVPERTSLGLSSDCDRVAGIRMWTR